MAICILVRHGETTFNVEGRINGDPAILVPLSARGREEATQLARHIAHIRIEVCVHTRFPRTLETAQIGLGTRADRVPLVCEALLDDINVGDLEGRAMTELGAWIEAHGPDDAYPGGESLHDAARRFAKGLRRLAARTEHVVLAVCHELPIRFALNAASGSTNLDQPEHQIANATPYLFEQATLEIAAAGIERLVDREASAR
jgi:broad specificity phosphatase PhoE